MAVDSTDVPIMIPIVSMFCPFVVVIAPAYMMYRRLSTAVALAVWTHQTIAQSSRLVVKAIMI